MRWGKTFLVWTWVLAALALGALLTLLHEAPLPPPNPTAGAPASEWTLTHGLALRCPCSRRIVDHLLARGATADAAEEVLLVDAADGTVRALEARGFRVRAVDADTLPRLGFEAVPGLVIRSPDGRVAYAGAHAPKRSGPVDDLSLLQRAREGASTRPFAVLGCAISQALTARVDPLSLKSLPRGFLP
ncbi:MAG: hypothetical protein MUC96_19875 [Myxococcaceae bacterium]|jgi:hypothetical protein|nr:hypothetical protein [Myxococcaceae bacterium]